MLAVEPLLIKVDIKHSVAKKDQNLCCLFPQNPWEVCLCPLPHFSLGQSEPTLPLPAVSMNPPAWLLLSIRVLLFLLAPCPSVSLLDYEADNTSLQNPLELVWHAARADHQPQSSTWSILHSKLVVSSPSYEINVILGAQTELTDPGK